MNRDKSLKKHGACIIFLVCGNSFVGKKTFVEKIIESQNEICSPINKSFYNVYNFNFTYKFEEKTLKFPIEIRIINSNLLNLKLGDERDSELKCNSSFYRGALGAYVILDDDYKNHQE